MNTAAKSSIHGFVRLAAEAGRGLKPDANNLNTLLQQLFASLLKRGVD